MLSREATNTNFSSQRSVTQYLYTTIRLRLLSQTKLYNNNLTSGKIFGTVITSSLSSKVHKDLPAINFLSFHGFISFLCFICSVKFHKSKPTIEICEKLKLSSSKSIQISNNEHIDICLPLVIKALKLY